MRLCPANKFFIGIFFIAGISVLVSPALAQQGVPPQMQSLVQMQQDLAQNLTSQLSRDSDAMGGVSGLTPSRSSGSSASGGGRSSVAGFGSASALSGLNAEVVEDEAHQLADITERKMRLEKLVGSALDESSQWGEPPLLEDLMTPSSQYDTEENQVDAAGIAKKDSIEMRAEAQREAALSYGARGGLARRNFEIINTLSAFEETLDRVFNFRALLVRAPSGLLIEPPIITEQIDAMLITAAGNEAAVTDRVLNYGKQARIVSAPRDWREYLLQPWTAYVPPPPRVLWPENAQEMRDWQNWVRQGWIAGVTQADDMFAANLNRLLRDYKGMIRYRMLLAQGMVSQPYTMHEDRGVTGSKYVMRVGDRAMRITGQSQFLTGSDLWKPADR